LLRSLADRCIAAIQENANRLKAYKANLVVFPRRAGKPKAGDASAEVSREGLCNLQAFGTRDHVPLATFHLL